ncbi:MAG: T9SS type A sorting domain-containing protein [Vicingaceae bacterium]
MKNLKPLFIPIGLIAIVIVMFSFTNNANVDTDEKCTIKIIKIENGVETVVDSTFDCDEGLSWNSSSKGIEKSIRKMLGSIVSMGDSGTHSFSFNMDIDDKKNGVKIMKFKAGDGDEEVEMDFDFKLLEDGENGVMKMMVNGKEMEIKVGDIESHLKHLGANVDVDFSTEDVEVLIENDENGEETHSVKIIKTVDEDGNVSVKKIVNGDEVGLDDDAILEFDNNHKMIFIEKGSENDGNHNVTIDLSVDSEDGKKMKKVIVISKKVTDEKSSKRTSKTQNSKKKELAINKLKFSPNPNKGKFDLSFEINKKRPVQIKILDLQGKEVYNELVSDFDGKYFKNIDISNNKEGVYILQIIQGNKMKSSKMVLK